MNPFYLRMIRAAVMQTDGPKKREASDSLPDSDHCGTETILAE